MRHAGLFSLLGLLWMSGLVGGCGTVEVNSEPRDAEIYLIRSNQERGQPLGKTPFKSSLSNLASLANEGPIVLQLEKKGYFPEKIVVPNVFGSDLKVSSTLLSSNSQVADNINNGIKIALRAEREILENKMDAALLSAAELRKISENIASSYDIEGSVYFLKGEYLKSLSAWEKSLFLYPDNADVKAMITRVRQRVATKGRE